MVAYEGTFGGRVRAGVINTAEACYTETVGGGDDGGLACTIPWSRNMHALIRVCDVLSRKTFLQRSPPVFANFSITTSGSAYSPWLT